MREYDDNDPEYAPDPEIGIWGWENAPTANIEAFKEGYIKFKADIVEKMKSHKEHDWEVSSNFNRAMIDLYNKSP